MESMRKMKRDLPTFAFGVDERGVKMVGEKHDGLVVLEKGKGKEKVVEVDGKEEETLLTTFRMQTLTKQSGIKNSQLLCRTYHRIPHLQTVKFLVH